MTQAPAWSALFLGLFLISVALGAIRRPGSWRQMMEEFEGSPALQTVAGMLELALGIVIYLACRGATPDWLAWLMMVVGGLMVAEALIVAAFGDMYIRFWMPRLSTSVRGWATLFLLFGMALTTVGLDRFF